MVKTRDLRAGINRSFKPHTSTATIFGTEMLEQIAARARRAAGRRHAESPGHPPLPIWQRAGRLYRAAPVGPVVIPSPVMASGPLASRQSRIAAIGITLSELQPRGTVRNVFR
jgi:hypothetical protein